MLNKLNRSKKTVIAMTLATLLTACGGGDEEVSANEANKTPIPTTPTTTPTTPTTPTTTPTTPTTIPTTPTTTPTTPTTTPTTPTTTPTTPTTIPTTPTVKIEGVVDIKGVTTVNIKDKNWGIIMSTQTDQNGNFSFDYNAVKKMIADKKLDPSTVIEISANNFNLAFKLPSSVQYNLKSQINYTSNIVYNLVYGKGFDSNTTSKMDALANAMSLDNNGDGKNTGEDLNNLSPLTIIPEQIGAKVYLRNLPEGKTIYYSYNNGISLYQISPDKSIDVMRGDTIKYFSFTTDNKKEPLGSFRVDDSKIN